MHPNVSKMKEAIVNTSHEDLTVPDVSSLPPNKEIVPVGHVILKGTNLNFSIFGFSVRDPSWAQFTLESYELHLTQTMSKSLEITRQLSIILGKSQISRMTEQEGKRWKTEYSDLSSRNASEEFIFRIPIATLILYSVQRVHSQEVEFYYLTEFTDSIVVSLNISTYAFLKEVALMHAKSIQEAGNTLFNQSMEDTYSENDIKTNVNLSSQTMKRYSVAQMRENRTFICKKFQLSPTLSFLGDSTPSLERVFRWLGIKNIDQTIPRGTYYLTDSLESVLEFLWDVSLWMEHLDRKL